jgi:poly(hydroxyalkanoate) depolymerase family esterase
MLGTSGQAASPSTPAARPDKTPPGEIIDLVPEQVRVERRAAPAPSADFTLHQFTCAHGELHYRLHRPDSLPPGAPLLVMLHGCTQDSADFARGTRMNALAEKAGFAVLWPEQSAAANPRRCWRWFEAAHQGPLAGEPATLLALCAAVATEHRLDAQHLHVAGLSAGGAMAAVLADSNDPRIAAIAVHSGLAAASARTMAGAMGAMRNPKQPKSRPGRLVPTLVLHGKTDQVVVPGNADLLFEQALKQARAPLSVVSEATEAGTRTIARDATGRRMVEQYMMTGLGHAWAGGDPSGSHTSPHGPDASQLILDFFAEQIAHRAAT